MKLLPSLEWTWRFCFAFGAVLPLSVFYFRWQMESSKYWKQGAIKRWRDLPVRLTLQIYWKELIGTCGTWFLYDFVTYPNSMYSGIIINGLIPEGPDRIQQTAQWQLLLGTLSSVGCTIGAFAADKIGPKLAMMIGFSLMAVVGFVVFATFDSISQSLPGFVLLFGVLKGAGNFGPGNMLHLVSTDSYPTAVRGICYGLSAAFGKAGAVAGGYAFLPIQARWGTSAVFLSTAICGVLGLALIRLIGDTRTVTLTERDESYRRRLRDAGWTGSMGTGEAD